jgi:MarR family transcriptional regulator, organic hydroperoxide resistance regulator
MKAVMALSDKQYLQINQAVFSLANAYRVRCINEKVEEGLGLKLCEQAVLMVIGQLTPVNSRQLSRAMNINPGTISVRLEGLIKKKLVRKEQDQKDRRNWRLLLTEEGEELYQLTIAGTATYTRDFVSVLSKNEQRDLHRSLSKIAHRLGYDWQ